MTAPIAALLQPIKDRLNAAREWDVCDSEQTVRAETGEIIYDRSGYDRSEWEGEYRPIASLIASSPTDQARLIAAVEVAEALAAAWQASGEHLKTFAKASPEDVQDSLNQQGDDLLWHANQIRASLASALESAA